MCKVPKVSVYVLKVSVCVLKVSVCVLTSGLHFKSCTSKHFDQYSCNLYVNKYIKTKHN